MPSRAPRICGCGAVVPVSTVCRCQERAARERKARFDQKRPSARERGYDRSWQEASKAFLAEAGNDLCECGAPAVLVRHVKSIRCSPHLRMVRANWRPGCHRCNAKDAARERQELEGKSK